MNKIIFFPSEKGGIDSPAIFLWILFYIYLGTLVGQRLGHPLIGAAIGCAAGLIVSLPLGMAAHYNSFIGMVGMLPIILLIIMMFLPAEKKLWVGVAGGVIPLLCLLKAAISSWTSKGEPTPSKETSQDSHPAAAPTSVTTEKKTSDPEPPQK